MLILTDDLFCLMQYGHRIFGQGLGVDHGFLHFSWEGSEVQMRGSEVSIGVVKCSVVKCGEV